MTVEGWLVFAGFMGMAAAFMLGTRWGISLEKDHWRREAVKNGHAQWVADANGRPEWRWKER